MYLYYRIKYGDSSDGVSLSMLQRIEPLRESRWEKFLLSHPRASVFHSREWLEALQKTYGYTPLVYTTSRPGSDLRDGLALCEIESWMTGRRLVSLPFSDHCEPLVDDPHVLMGMLTALQGRLRDERWRYLELRPLNVMADVDSSFQSTRQYFHHRLDLRPNLDSLFGHFHKDSTQRKIKRAHREGLSYREGRSEALLESFYKLFLITRRRHHIPPQPLQWFRNLIAGFKDALQIRVAFKGAQAIAAILTLQYKNTLTYKYGCSDPHMNNLGGTHLLFWNAIQAAKSQGMTCFDLGRSEVDNTGLITFKDRWGASRKEMSYLRYYPGGNSNSLDITSKNDWKLRLAKQIFARSPDTILRAAGNLLYRHIG
jgi:CelD/BcsL family acetyltransferase involved in cellulose biosynthesis